jgi:hypothetical protein
MNLSNKRAKFAPRTASAGASHLRPKTADQLVQHKTIIIIAILISSAYRTADLITITI